MLTSVHRFRDNQALWPGPGTMPSEARERDDCPLLPTAHLALRDRVRVPRIFGVPTGPLCLHPTLMYDEGRGKAVPNRCDQIGKSDYKIV